MSFSYMNKKKIKNFLPKNWYFLGFILIIILGYHLILFDSLRSFIRILHVYNEIILDLGEPWKFGLNILSV